MKLESLWVLKSKSRGVLMTCAEHADPIALFESKSQALEHLGYYEDGDDDDFEPVLLTDCLQ